MTLGSDSSADNSERVDSHYPRGPVYGLTPGFFKVSYVTDNIDQHAATFFSTFGIDHFFRQGSHQVPVSDHHTATIDKCCAWAGGLLLELIQPLSDPFNYYSVSDMNNSRAKLHHIARLYPDQQSLDNAVSHYQSEGFPLALFTGSTTRQFSLDMREQLGHRIEGVLLNKDMKTAAANYPGLKKTLSTASYPEPTIPPYPGYYQFTYITNDFDRTITLFEKIFGITHFMEMRPLEVEMNNAKPARMNCALAYVGAMEIEIMNPVEGDVSIYTDEFDSNDYQIKHHHVSRLFLDFDTYEQRADEFTRMGKKLIANNHPGERDIPRFYYVDCRSELGHYLESSIFDAPVREWIDSFPRF